MVRAAILAASTFALALAPVSQAWAAPGGNGNGNGNGAANGNGGVGNGNGNGNGGGNGNSDPGACSKPNPPPNNPNCGDPVALTVQSDIDFGRLVLLGDGIGHVVLDLGSGDKITFGGIDDLGGFAVKGQALVTGSPNRVIRVDIPTVITMADPAGGQAELRDIVTNLGSLPLLDTNGQLTFEFSGTLYTDTATALGGTLRGRIPISVQYN